jgi:hypothetical protein
MPSISSQNFLKLRKCTYCIVSQGVLLEYLVPFTFRLEAEKLAGNPLTFYVYKLILQKKMSGFQDRAQKKKRKFWFGIVTESAVLRARRTGSAACPRERRRPRSDPPRGNLFKRLSALVQVWQRIRNPHGTLRQAGAHLHIETLVRCEEEALGKSYKPTKEALEYM